MLEPDLMEVIERVQTLGEELHRTTGWCMKMDVRLGMMDSGTPYLYYNLLFTKDGGDLQCYYPHSADHLYTLCADSLNPVKEGLDAIDRLLDEEISREGIADMTLTEWAERRAEIGKFAEA